MLILMRYCQCDGFKCSLLSTYFYDMFIQYLNTNQTMYDAVKKAERERHLLTEEAHRAACFLRADFERGGIHLCAGIGSAIIVVVVVIWVRIAVEELI